MSETDSFIDEVTEEVRRDRLFATFRKYGWIGVLLVVVIVGGAAWNEWQKNRATESAQAFGDGVLDALDLGAPEDRQAALSALSATGDQVALRQMLLASDLSADKVGSLAALDALIADTAQPEIYRDLAVIKRVLLTGSETPLADRRSALEAVAIPGRAFRVLALEQLAYLLIEEGKTDEAISALKALSVDQESPSGMRQRLAQVIVALGGKVEDTAAAGADAAG